MEVKVVDVIKERLPLVKEQPANVDDKLVSIYQQMYICVTACDNACRWMDGDGCGL